MCPLPAPQTAIDMPVYLSALPHSQDMLSYFQLKLGISVKYVRPHRCMLKEEMPQYDCDDCCTHLLRGFELLLEKYV